MRRQDVGELKISEICHHNPHTAVAVEAPDNAQATASVTVDFTAVAATGTTVLDAVIPAETPLVAALPQWWRRGQMCVRWVL